MRMDVGKFIRFALNAQELERKEQIRRQWTAMLPLMSIQYLKYMPFEEYCEQCTGANIDIRSNEEIIADIEETHRRAHEKKEGE
jgi:hypothetical protein